MFSITSVEEVNGSSPRMGATHAWGPNIARGRIAEFGDQKGEMVEISWSTNSTLLVAKLVEAITDGLTNTETTEQPIIRVPPIVVDSSTVSLVVAAILASRGGGTLWVKVSLRRTRGRFVRRHLNRACRAMVLIKVGVVRSTAGDVARLRHADGFRS
jgi:hypothetical protein